jgi:hypothetical protein
MIRGAGKTEEVAWEVFVHPGQEIDLVVLAVGVIERSPCAESH